MSITVGDATSIVTAGVSVAGVLGAAIGWVWREIKKGRRADAIRFQRIEADLEKCRQREDRAKTRTSGQLTIIELLFVEVRRLLGLTGQQEGSHALTRAKALMDKLKIDLPDSDDPDLADLAEELDRRNRRHG